MDVTVKTHCCLCSETTENVISLPDGWAHQYGEVDIEENGFCPAHSVVADFAASQCPGCVGGWGDCPMWKAFAFTGTRDVTEHDLAVIRTGKCPRRVNGSLGFSRAAGIEDIDLSDEASTKSGVAFADAIVEYMRQYPI